MIKLKLDEMLTKRNMSAYALHINSGKRLHQSVISKIKNNDSKHLKLETLDLLCELLECQPGDLITYENGSATQSVNATTQIVERATQNVKQTAPLNGFEAVKAKKKELRIKEKSERESGKVFNNSILEIVNSSSDNEYTLTTAAAGELLNLSPRSVRENAEKGLLPGKQGKQSHWYFRRSDVDGFISRRG